MQIKKLPNPIFRSPSGSARRLCLLLAGAGWLVSGCAGLPSGLPANGAVDMTKSYAVKQIESLKKKEPGADVHDPRGYYHYLMGLKFEREGDFDKAADHFAELAAHEPGNEEFHQHLMALYLRTGQLDAAVALAAESLPKFPENLLIRMIYADILAVRGQYGDVLREYRLVMKNHPEITRARIMIAYSLEALGRNKEAIAAYREVTKIDPHNLLGHFYLGRALAMQGNFEEARKALQRTLQLRPSIVEARKHLARVLVLEKNYAKALEQYQILLKFQPNQELQDYVEKVREWARAGKEAGGEAAIDLPPIEKTPIHALMGAIYYEQGAYLRALDEFRLALAKKEDLEIRLITAKIFELIGRMDKSIQEIETYRRQNKGPDRVGILLQLARLYGLDSQMEESVKLLRASLKLQPSNDRLFHSLALAQMSLNRFPKAIKSIQKAIALNQKKDTYYFELGALYERMGEYQQSVQAMRQVLSINPNHSNAHNFIGYLFAVQGTNLDEAVNHLQKALSVQPRNGYFLDSLGWIYFKKGNFVEALRQIKRAMIYTSPDPVLYDHLGDVHFSMKNFPEARKAWKTSLALAMKKQDDPNSEVPDPEELQRKIQKTKRHLNNPLD
ncbi:MAG: tetratricopeptide repeat protein [Nitrospinaceae bacterium]